MDKDKASIISNERNNEYLVWLLQHEIKNEELIISNASKACHNIKTFIVCFLLPFLGVVLTGYFTSFKIGRDYVAKAIYISICIFILLILSIIQILTHRKFYRIQASHRKRLGSLNLMLGTAIRNNIVFPSPFSYETLGDFLNITEKISEKSNAKSAKEEFIKDTLIYSIPLAVLLMFCIIALIIIISYGFKKGW